MIGDAGKFQPRGLRITLEFTAKEVVEAAAVNSFKGLSNLTRRCASSFAVALGNRVDSSVDRPLRGRD